MVSKTCQKKENQLPAAVRGSPTSVLKLPIESCMDLLKDAMKFTNTESYHPVIANPSESRLLPLLLGGRPRWKGRRISRLLLSARGCLVSVLEPIVAVLLVWKVWKSWKSNPLSKRTLFCTFNHT